MWIFVLLLASAYGKQQHVKDDTLLNEYLQLSRFIAEMARNISDHECQKQILHMADALANSSLWAVQMLDSTVKIPVGLIVANTYQLGHYDECVEISTVNVMGKYCLADIEFSPTSAKYPDFNTGQLQNEFSLHYDPYKPVWDKFKVTLDPSKKRRDRFHIGVCIPDKCSAEQVQTIAGYIFTQYGSKYGYNFNSTVAEITCSTKANTAWSTGSSVFMYLIAFCVLAVVLGTAWDILRDRSATNLNGIQRLLECFSMHRTMARLSQPDQSHELNVFHGMKFYSTALIILGHRCVHTYGAPFFNPQFLEERYRIYGDMFLLNGSLIVDTFFMIGGYLTCYGLLMEQEAGRKISSRQVYIFRWLRITPMYMLVVFFYACVFQHLGSGPLWNMKVGREAQRCLKNWWTNLFYVNNYIKNEEMCMFQSWYISCDMQFTLAAPFLVNTLARAPRRGVFQLLGAITIAAIVPFVYTYYYKYDGVLRVYMQIFEDLPKNRTFADMYIKSHHRAVPYLVGIAGAYIFVQLKKKQFLFSKWMIWLGALISTGLSIWAIWGAWIFYIPGREYNALENAAYASMHRIAWSVSMAWIPVAGGLRAFGIIQPILSKQALAPLSRLSFGAFLVHGVVQLYFTGSMRIPEYVSFPRLFWMTAGDVVFSFLLSLVLHILFESPLAALIGFLLPKSTMDKKMQDCYFYYYSTCTKGEHCGFRHEPSALGCETVCQFWRQGKCVNLQCNLRHMELKKDRKSIPCFWETQPGGCRKPHCPFLHQAARNQAPPLPTDAKECAVPAAANSGPRGCEQPGSDPSILAAFQERMHMY